MAILKYVIFFGVLFFGVPIGYSISKTNKKVENIVLFLAMFFTCRLAETINFVSRENYRGTSRGFEITLVDLATLILFFLVINRKKMYKIKVFPPGSFLYFLYFLFSVISIKNAPVPLYSFFELWKMVRVYFYFWTFYNYVQNTEQLERIVKYIGYIIIYIFITVLQQKYMEGRFQCPGPFPHQNSMVMYLIIYGSIMFAALMNSKGKKSFDSLFYFSTFGMASICIISSLSRAGLGLYAFSIMIMFLLSYLSGISFKKVGISILFILMGAAVLYKAMDTIVERFETAPENSANTRVELANAAAAMADDFPFGSGLNNYSLRMLPPYRYYLYRREDSQEEGGIVETAYLLIAAETGWHNLVIFLLMLFRFYFMNLFNYFRYKRNALKYVAIGLIGALSAIYIETALEWVLKQTNNFYQLMFIFAIIGVMAKIAKTDKFKIERKKKK